MQAAKLLESMIVYRNCRDDSWIELKWNPVIEQMWQGFKLSRAERDMIKNYMERQRQGRIAWGYEQDRMYEGDELCGWDVHRYIRSVENTFDEINQLITF